LNKDTFAGFHPAVNLFYFAVVIGFAMFFMHPISLAISLVCAFTYSVHLNGKKTVKMWLIFLLPLIIIATGINPLFNHQGGTIVGYLPNGNPLTLESIMFGLAAAVMLATVITWFSCFNTVMSSDKIIYLFGRIIPALSLILAMALRLVPRFRDQIKVISNAQKCIGRDVSDGNIFRKARHGIKILSIMITWALENAIETADSMKARGYGLPRRTAFSIFRFDRRDVWAAAYIFVCCAIVIAGAVTEVSRFRYFPTIRGEWAGFWTAAVFFVHFALGIFPIIVSLKEDITWKNITSSKLRDGV